MAEIPFTQYMLPHGRKKQVSIERPDEIGRLATRIQRAGYWFECEVLSTGDVSFTITDDDADHDIEVCPNGPAVPGRVDELISRFAKRLDTTPEDGGA